MKRRQISQISITILLSLLAMMTISCEKEIDVNLRSVDPILVIEGKVMEDSLVKVRLTTTKDFYSENEFPPVTKAEVIVSDNSGNKETLILNPDGWYTTNGIKGVIGKSYLLTVIHEGKTYTATSTMPSLVKIDSIMFQQLPILDYPFPILCFSDPSGEENQYYRYIVYVNDKRIKRNRETISAEFVDGYPLKQIVSLFFDQSEDDKKELEKGDVITIDLYSIDKGTYLFFETLGDIENSLNNPTTNISGGALGYFGAYPMDRKTITADW